ncbi:uncharacterized protein LOC144236473 [Crocuta crocuta]
MKGKQRSRERRLYTQSPLCDLVIESVSPDLNSRPFPGDASYHAMRSSSVKGSIRRGSASLPAVKVILQVCPPVPSKSSDDCSSDILTTTSEPLWPELPRNTHS